MDLKNCPKCNGPGKMWRSPANHKLHNNVWVQCELCGYRTGSFYEDKGAPDGNSGEKFAALLWNIDSAREGPGNGKN